MGDAMSVGPAGRMVKKLSRNQSAPFLRDRCRKRDRGARDRPHPSGCDGVSQSPWWPSGCLDDASAHTGITLRSVVVAILLGVVARQLGVTFLGSAHTIGGVLLWTARTGPNRPTLDGVTSHVSTIVGTNLDIPKAEIRFR